MIEEECQSQGQLFIIFPGLVLSMVYMIYYGMLRGGGGEEEQVYQVRARFSIHTMRQIRLFRVR